MAAALDRTKVSDRKAIFVLTAPAKCLGQDVGELNINCSSIRRAREQQRKSVAQQLKEQFQTDSPLVVFWDSKLLPDLIGRELVDRLPVIVSKVGITQLLGVPKLSSSTGENQASAVVHLLQEWKMSDKVKAMCFDTTACNTGPKSDACVLIEQKLEKDLLYLACRHHIFELVLATVFKECMSGSSGPDVAIFKRFRQNWAVINQTKFDTATTIDEMPRLRSKVQESRDFALKQLEEQQLRDDYHELLELTVIFLGSEPPCGTHFMAPGAMHHARWMA